MEEEEAAFFDWLSILVEGFIFGKVFFFHINFISVWEQKLSRNEERKRPF